MTRYGRPTPSWPTIYTEHKYSFPITPGRLDSELGRFALTLVRTLITSLPSGYEARYSRAPAIEGRGVAPHQLELDSPVVMPRVVVTTSPDIAPWDGLRHYRFSPRAFDSRANWALPAFVTEAANEVVGNLHDAVRGRDLAKRRIGNEYFLLQVQDFLNTNHPSSYRLGRGVTSIANHIIGVECDVLDVAPSARPTVQLEGLALTATRQTVIAHDCPASL